MTVLSDKTLRLIKPLEPFVEQDIFFLDNKKSMSFGLSQCGYDIRIDQMICLGPSGLSDTGISMRLASSLEKFNIPNDVMGVVYDKSSWARRGLSVFCTVIEPGWRGFLTLELKNMSNDPIVIPEGCPIAQVVFHRLDQECEKPYNGKYQDQQRGPQNAR